MKALCFGLFAFFSPCLIPFGWWLFFCLFLINKQTVSDWRELEIMSGYKAMKMEFPVSEEFQNKCHCLIIFLSIARCSQCNWEEDAEEQTVDHPPDTPAD